MKPTARSVVVAVCLVLVGGLAAARADFMFIPWSYGNPTNGTVITPGADGGLSLPNRDFIASGGDSRIQASPLVAWSSAPADAPDTVVDGAYTFGLEIRDEVSGAVATLEFAGVLNGTIWQTGSDLTNVFTGPTTRSVDLGANRYNVSLSGFVAPTGYGVDEAGGFSGSVSVRPRTGSGPTDPPTATPEPGTLVMAALGLPLAGLARVIARRRRR
jgi:hypothetical protein